MKKIFAAGALVLAAALTFAPTVSAQTDWSKYSIMLDPGHGGSDPGASGPTAPHEATLALRCANSLVDNFKGSKIKVGYKLTRTSDVYVSLSARKSASVSYDPYIFCSIHLNAFNGSANGTETWYYWSAGNSLKLANKVHASLMNEMKRVNRGVKQNGWTVITGSSSVPAILTEGLFVDNVTEHNLIKTAGSTGYNNWVNGHFYGFYDHLNQTLGANINNPRGGTGSTTADPKVTVSPTSWKFNGTVGGRFNADFKVTGANLTSNITVALSGTNKSEFDISTGSITNTGGNLTCAFVPTSAGDKTATVTLTSGTAKATITLTGTATVPALQFTEKWNYSVKNGTSTAKTWDATKVRNMTYADGKLYLVYNHSDIKVIKSGTCSDNGILGNLNKGDVVKGGTYDLCDVKACDGKIVACNLAGTADIPLRIYVWDNDKAMPRLAMETSNFGGAKRIGDCLGWKGTWTSGELVFANDDGATTRIITYKVTNGTISSTPTVKNATTDGTTQLKTAASTRVYPQDDGTYWLDGKDNRTSKLDKNAKQTLYIDQDESWGNAITTFTWNGVPYALATTFAPRELNDAGQMIPEKNYIGACAQLLRCDDGYTKPEIVGSLPAKGLSDTNRNTNCVQDVIVNQTANYIEAWVLSYEQGLAYFINQGATEPTYTYETIPVLATTPTISANKSSVSINSAWGSSASATVKVSGASLKGDITAELTGTDANLFSINKTSVTPTDGAVTDAAIKVTFAPQTTGTFKANLVLKSSEANTVTIPITGIGEEQVTYSDEIEKLEPVWNFSTNNNTLGQAPWFTQYSTSHPRSMAVIGDNLYVLVSKSWGSADTDVIIQLNATTGALVKTISCTGVSGGQFSHGSIAALGSKLILANQARPTDALKVYEINTTSGAATLLLEDASHGGANLGDNIDVYGDATSGRIAFAGLDANNALKVVWYAVSNNKITATPNVITPSEASAGIRSCTSVNFESDGSFWLTTRHQNPTLYKADGTIVGTVSVSVPKVYGTASALVNYGKNKYLAVANPLGSTASANYGNVALQLVKVTDGQDKAVLLGTYPEAGLGEQSWDGAAVTAVAHRNTGDNDSKADFYVLASKQGIAHYSFNGKSTTIEEIINLDEAAAANAEYYNLQGIRVNGENLTPGLYIRKSAAGSAKVLVR